MWRSLFQLVEFDVQVTHDGNQKSMPKSLVWAKQEKYDVEGQTVSYKNGHTCVCTNKTEKDEIDRMWRRKV